MLHTYLSTKETIDVSLAKRMTAAPHPVLKRSSTSSSSLETATIPSPPDSHTNTGILGKGAFQPSQKELDLDNFMASLTADESPDVVIKTIVGKHASKRAPK